MSLDVSLFSPTASFPAANLRPLISEVRFISGEAPPVSAINPSYALGAFTAGSGGEPDSVAVVGAYAGADTVDAYFATSNSATPPSAAQMEAGTGGTIVQSASVLGYTGAQADLSAFTNDTVTHLHAYFKERTNGGETTVSTTALTDIDFTAPTISGWTTNTAGDTISGTISKSALIPGGQPATGDFTLAGVAAGSAIASVFVSGTSISLSIAANAAVNSDTSITIAYTQGANTIQDARGNEVASFGATGVTNAVPAPGSFAPTFVTSGAVNLANATSGTVIASVSVVSGNKYVAAFTSRGVSGTARPSGMTLGEVAGTETLSVNTGSDNHCVAVYEFVADTTGTVALAVSDSVGTGFQHTGAGVWDITGGQVKGTPTVQSAITGLSISHNQALVDGEFLIVGFADRLSSGASRAAFQSNGYTERGTFPITPTSTGDCGFGDHAATVTETRTISTTLSTAINVNGVAVVNCVVEAV